MGQVLFFPTELPSIEGDKSITNSLKTVDSQEHALSITFMGQPLGSTKNNLQLKKDSLETPLNVKNIASDSILGESDDLMLMLIKDSLAAITDKLIAFRQPLRMRSPDVMYRDVPSILPIRIHSWAEYRVSSGFGMRVHPIKGTYQNHSGLDFPQPKFSPVYATADGVVNRIIWQPDGLGLAIYLTHSSGYQTGYGHLEDHSVLVGETVKRGQQIGQVGSTGLSTGPHLHYTVLAGNQPVDPTEFCFLMLNALNAQSNARSRVK